MGSVVRQPNMVRWLDATDFRRRAELHVKIDDLMASTLDYLKYNRGELIEEGVRITWQNVYAKYLEGKTAN